MLYIKMLYTCSGIKSPLRPHLYKINYHHFKCAGSP